MKTQVNKEILHSNQNQIKHLKCLKKYHLCSYILFTVFILSLYSQSSAFSVNEKERNDRRIKRKWMLNIFLLYSQLMIDFYYCQITARKAFTIQQDMNEWKGVKQIWRTAVSVFWWMWHLKICMCACSCFRLCAIRCLSNWENIWFTRMHVTNSIRPNNKTYLLLHFSFKIAWFYINRVLSIVTLPVSVLDSFFSTAWRLASNMSCPWSGGPPHTHRQRAQQKVVATIAIPLHPVPVRSGADTHLYLWRTCKANVRKVTPNKSQ